MLFYLIYFNLFYINDDFHIILSYVKRYIFLQWAQLFEWTERFPNKFIHLIYSITLVFGNFAPKYCAMHLKKNFQSLSDDKKYLILKQIILNVWLQTGFDPVKNKYFEITVISINKFQVKKIHSK